MAIKFRASTTARGSASTATITIPADVQVGDVMYIGVSYKLTGTNNVNTPSGWTDVPSCEISGPTVGFQSAVFRKTAAGGDVGGAATVSITCNSGSQQIECEFVAYGGCEDAPRASALIANSTTASTSVTCTTQTSQALDVVLLFAAWRGSNTSGPSGSPNLTASPAGFVLRQQSTNTSSSANVGAAFADNIASPGTTGTVAFTSDATAYSIGGQIILVPTMTAPTFSAEGETTWTNSNTGVAKTASVTINAGEQIAVVGMSEDSVATLATPTGGTGITYTLKQSVVVANYGTAYLWTGTSATTQTFTLSITMTVSGGGSRLWGFTWETWANSDGIGATTKTNVSSGAPSLGLTSLYSNSSAAAGWSDWNAVDGASRTWRTVNSITPTAGNGGERTYFRDSAHYATYVGHWTNVGAYGSKTLGASAPAGQKYAIVAAEILGHVPVDVTVTDTPSGTRAGGTPSGTTIDVGAGDTTVAAAPSTGVRGAGTPSTVTIAAVVADHPVGVRAGGTPATVAAGTSVTDTSRGVRAAGTATTVVAAVTVIDRPTGTRAGGSPTTVAASVVATDTARGARAGGTPASAQAGTTVVDTPRGVRAGRTSTTITTAVAVTDTARGTRAGCTASGLTFATTIPDRPAGARTAGTPSTTAITVAVPASPSGAARAGSPAGTAAAGVVTADHPTGVRAGGSGATATVAVTVTDASRGARASGTPTGLTYHTALADTPRGARAAGTPATVSVGSGDDLVITDRPTGVRAAGGPSGVTYTTTISQAPTGARAGSTPTTVTVDVVIVDHPVGVRAGTTAAQPTTGVTVTDTATPVRAGGTPGAAVISVVTVDTPQGARAATSSAAVTYETLVADTPHGARAGNTPASVGTGGPADVAIADRSSGARAGQVVEVRTITPGRLTVAVARAGLATTVTGPGLATATRGPHLTTTTRT